MSDCTPWAFDHAGSQIVWIIRVIGTCLLALCPCAVSTVFWILPGWSTPVFGSLKKLSLDQAVGTEKLQRERINVLETLSDHGGPTRYYTPRFLPQLRLESSSPVDSTPNGCNPLTTCRLLCLVLLAVRSCPAACVGHLRMCS